MKFRKEFHFVVYLFEQVYLFEHFVLYFILLLCIFKKIETSSEPIIRIFYEASMTVIDLAVSSELPLSFD